MTHIENGIAALDAGAIVLERGLFVVINVKAAPYNALGDNSNDDTAEIQAAIDAASAAGGGIVYLPPGTYRISSALSVPNFVELWGAGQTSILRCTGNHYAVNWNQGNRAAARGIQMDALSSQSSGGGFDFTNAQFNIRIDDIYFGNNLHTSLNIKPDESSGHFLISRVKWNGVSGCTNGILIGDGTNLVAHCELRDLLGTAASAAGMTNWMTVKNNVDTLKADNVEFYTGTNGIAIGEAAAGTVSDSFMSRVLVDSMSTGYGLNVSKCRGLNVTDVQLQTNPKGMNIGANVLGLKVKGGTIQNNTDDGVDVQAGAAHWSFDDVTVSDNNTANGAFGQGFDFAGVTSNWSITNCRIGNNILLTTGHQKYGINLPASALDNFRIENNTFAGNETAPMQNLATGGKQRIEGNIGAAVPSVAAAATTTLPGDPVVTITGNTGITAITASYAGRRVTLLFSGTPTVTDGSNLKLAGNFVAAGTTNDVDSLTLVCDGTNWIEEARSTN